VRKHNYIREWSKELLLQVIKTGLTEKRPIERTEVKESPLPKHSMPDPLEALVL
jgi:hypothetical protein